MYMGKLAHLDMKYLYKPVGNIILNGKVYGKWQRLNAFPIRSVTRQNICSHLSFNVVMKVLPTGIKQEKNKGVQIGKEEKLPI